MSQIVYKGRRNTNSMKWDNYEEKFGNEKLLPLWATGMGFEVPECVKDAIKEYTDFGMFEYYNTPHAYADVFIRWEEIYHNYQVKREWMCFAPGVVPAVNWLMHILTKEQGRVIIMPPVYYSFHNAILNSNRQPVESPLVCAGNGHVIDYRGFEKKTMGHDVKLLILCSPRNPVGRARRSGEIQKVLDICKKRHVYVISDEIHQDIIMKGHEHVVVTTTGTYDDMLVILTAGIRTFNLAACQNSALVIPDQGPRDKYDQYLERLRINGGNAFGYITVQSVYEKGRDWLGQVLDIIETNCRYMRNVPLGTLTDVWASEPEGACLMWIDLGRHIEPEDMKYVVQDKCSLAVDYGSWFGEGRCDGFIHINLATSKENTELAAQNIIRALKHV